MLTVTNPSSFLGHIAQKQWRTSPFVVRVERETCMYKYKNDNPEPVQGAMETAEFTDGRFS